MIAWTICTFQQGGIHLTNKPFQEKAHLRVKAMVPLPKRKREWVVQYPKRGIAWPSLLDLEGMKEKKTWLNLIGPCCFTLWVKYCLSLYTKLLQLTGVVRITPLEVSCDVLSWGWKHAEKMTVKPRFKIFKLFKERSPKLFLKIFVFFKFSALVIFLASLKLADICCQFFLDCCSQKTFWRAGSCSVA